MNEPLDLRNVNQWIESLSGRARLSKERLQRLVRAADSRLAERPLPDSSFAPLPVTVRPSKATAPRPPRGVQIRLASGRVVTAQVAPALARHEDLKTVARTTNINSQQTFQTLVQHARAIDDLKTATKYFTRRLQELQQEVDVALVGGLAGIIDLKKQVINQQTQLGNQQAKLASKVGRQTSALVLQSQTETVQHIADAINTMQASAYGVTGNVFARNNLLLAGNQLLWSSIDGVLRRYGIWSGSAPHPLTWLGPLLALGLAHVVRESVRPVVTNRG